MVCKWATTVAFVVLLCPSTGKAEITRADLQELKTDLQELKTDLKQYMDVRFSALEMKIKALEREVTIVEWMVGGILIIVVAVLGLPQFVGMTRESKERRDMEAFERRLSALEKQLAT